ncbi:hypothetical protein HaLaN_09920, partial [Haematococcus lacustris]
MDDEEDERRQTRPNNAFLSRMVTHVARGNQYSTDIAAAAAARKACRDGGS